MSSFIYHEVILIYYVLHSIKWIIILYYIYFSVVVVTILLTLLSIDLQLQLKTSCFIITSYNDTILLLKLWMYWLFWLTVRDRQINQLIDRLTDIATYRAVITAKNLFVISIRHILLPCESQEYFCVEILMTIITISRM